MPDTTGIAERLAGLRHALDCLRELPGDLGLLRVPEVEAVRDRERHPAGARDVPRRLEDGQRAAGPRVERSQAALAVERDREAAVRRPQPEHRRVEPGPAHGPRADEVVVAAEDRAAARDVRCREQREERVGVRPDRRVLDRPLELARLRLDPVAGRLLGEEPRRDLADDLAVVEAAELAAPGDLADHGHRELPLPADRLDLLQPLGLDDRDHPLLALGDHDLVRLEVGLAERHAVEVDVDSGAALAGHLGERRREAGRAEILQRDDEPSLDELEARLDQLLAGERVADLDRRPLVLVLVRELLAREHARAADAVAAGRRAVEDDQVPDPGGARARDPLGR